MIGTVMEFIAGEIVMRILIWPLSRLVKWRKSNIEKGIEIRSMKLNAQYDIYPQLALHFTIVSHTTANIQLKKMALVLQSGQREFMRIYAYPELDSMPSVVKANKSITVNLKFNPPVEWWLESRTNIGIQKAFLEATSMWGRLEWPVTTLECSATDSRLIDIGNEYLCRIGLKKAKKRDVNSANRQGRKG